MKKKHLLPFLKVTLALLLGVFAFTSCGDDDNDDGKNLAQKQQESVVSKLAANEDLSIFTASFEAIDFSSSPATEFTVFAVKNDALPAEMSQNEVKRHVISGAYSLDDLKSLTSIKSVSGVTLSVSTNDGKVYINGIELGSSLTADKSIIYTIDEVIPNEVIEEPATAYAGLVLNEICGLQNPDDDWIELANTTSSSMDLSGLQLIKTDETGTETSIYTIPDGTTIAPYAYLVVNSKSANRSENELGPITAGISNSKQVGIALVQPDGETLIDSFDRDADIGEDLGHILGGSYARVPDGTGEWVRAYISTRGEANSVGELPNVDYTGLILNEICGKQSPEDDWIEILNTSENDINISGVQVIKTDEDGIKETIFSVPIGVTIEAGAYFVINTEDSNRGGDELGPITAGISNSKQVGIALVQPDGETLIDSFDRDADVGENLGHLSGGSYARIPNGTGDWEISYSATRGEENAKGTVPGNGDYTGLVLNEINGDGTKYVELYNNSDNSIDLSGVVIKKNDSELYTIPSGTSIAGKSTKTFVSGTDFSGGISAKKSLKIELFAPDGTTSIDVFKNLNSDDTEVWDTNTPKYNGETNSQSYGRSPDGTGDWYMLTATRDASNESGSEKIIW